MPIEAIRALLWRRCGVADVRALLGHGGGHEVIAWGKKNLWKTTLGITVLAESRGGTAIPVVSEEAPDSEAEIHTYFAEGREEVRLKVPPMADAGFSVVSNALSLRDEIDPDASPSDKYVVMLIQTTDERLHIRGVRLSEMPAPVKQWVQGATTGGKHGLKGVFLEPLEAEVWSALRRHKSVLLYGPAGTGKTRLMLRLRNAFVDGVATVGFDPTDQAAPLNSSFGEEDPLPKKREWRFTTFHQSLTYETFVVGLAPKDAGAGGLKFEARNGMFLDLAHHALQPDSCSLLLIDELNRGNVADIFGELITVLEQDKRLGPAGEPSDQTVAVMLPIKPASPVSQRFEMPSPFYLVASMNALDRSVAPLDSALRRRFRQIHIRPDVELTQRLLLGGQPPVETLEDPYSPSDIEIRSLALGIMDRVNAHILSYWGPEFMLGHSYFLGVSDAMSLVHACDETILPLLTELYRDQPAALAELLGTPDSVGSDAIAQLPSEWQATSLSVSGTPAVDIVVLGEVAQADLGSAMRGLFWLGRGVQWSDPSGGDQPESGEEEVGPDDDGT